MTEKATSHRVFCISEVNHFRNADFVEWALSGIKINYLPCNINPADKRIEIRDDHGKKTLTDFSHKLVKEPFVVEVVNSLPFNGKILSRATVKSRDLLEIRFPSKSISIGVVVRTTARSEIEAEYMAIDILNRYL